MIDICVPVYNEGGNIKKLLEALEREVKSDFRLLIIYDSEKDDTLPVLNEIKGQYPYEIELIKNHYGRGAAYAVRTGIECVKSDFWVLMMADLSDDPATVDQMYRKMQQGYDMVAGSRYMRGGKKHGGPLLQSFLSRAAGLGMYFLLGFPAHDLSNAFKMYRTSALRRIPLESADGFEVCVELVIKTWLAGYQEGEVPTEWHDRTAGESNFKMWQWIPKYLHWCFYALRYRVTRKKPPYHREFEEKQETAVHIA